MWQLVACCLRLAACSLTLANLVKKFLAAFNIASRQGSVVLKEPRCKIVVFNSSLHITGIVGKSSLFVNKAPPSLPSSSCEGVSHVSSSNFI